MSILFDIFQPSRRHLDEERERLKMDIVQRPATGPGPIDLPEAPDPAALPAPGPDPAALPPDLG